MDVLRAKYIVQSQRGAPVQIGKSQCPEPDDATDTTTKNYTDLTINDPWTRDTVDLTFGGAGTSRTVTVSAFVAQGAPLCIIFVPGFSFIPATSADIVATNELFQPTRNYFASTISYDNGASPIFDGICSITEDNNGTMALSTTVGWVPLKDYDNVVNIKPFSIWWVQKTLGP